MQNILCHTILLDPDELIFNFFYFFSMKTQYFLSYDSVMYVVIRSLSFCHIKIYLIVA